MKKFLTVLCVVALSAPAFAATALTSGDVKINPFLRMKMVDDDVSKTNNVYTDLSGIQFSKKFGDNLSVVVTPGFNGSVGINGEAPSATMNFALIEGFFAINDITKGHGNYGIEFVAGQYESTFFKMEQNYQPFRFIYMPIDSKLMNEEYVDLGAMVGKSFANGIVNVSLGFVSGRNYLSSPTGADSGDNAGARVVATVYPFKNAGEEVRDLSLTMNLKSVFRAEYQSNYNFLVGYKYDKFAASVEYLGTYNNDIDVNGQKALSIGASYDVWGPLQALARWDYVKSNITDSPRDHLVLLGMNTKWFDDKLQAAVTYDQTYLTVFKTTMNKRLMIATQVSL